MFFSPQVAKMDVTGHRKPSKSAVLLVQKRRSERGTGTVRTVFQEPKPEPSLSVKTILKSKNPFQRGTVGTENHEPLEPSHARTVTKPNWTGATLFLLPEWIEVTNDFWGWLQRQDQIAPMLAIPAAIYRSALGPGAFRVLLGTCLGVPQRVLFECFLALLGLKNAKKHSKSSLGALRGKCPKALEKHSVGHFPARAPQHSCKWRPGSQPNASTFIAQIQVYRM